MQAPQATKSRRQPTNLSLDSALLKEAKALGINVSRSAEAGIAEAVKRHKQEKWLKENAKKLWQVRTHTSKLTVCLSRGTVNSDGPLRHERLT